MTIWIGIFGFAIAFYVSLKGGHAELYWQWHSFWIVGIGTLSIFFMIFPSSVLRSLLYSMRHYGFAKSDFQQHLRAVEALAKNKNAKVEINHPLLKYAHQLWQQGVNPDLFIVLISEKKQELEATDVDVIHGLKNLAKYPPALGMLGTVMGMIDLFSNLNTNKGLIGPALSVAMTATLFGVVLANVVISPLADRLQALHIKEQRLNTSIYEVILLINANEPLVLIEEEIKTRAA